MTVCDGLIDKINKDMNVFRNKRRESSSIISNTKDQINSIKDEPLNDINEVKNDISNSKTIIENEMNDVENESSALTGSCFDGVTNQLKSILNNVGDKLQELLTPDKMELGALGNLSKLKKFIEKLGIAGLISKLDELIGCLGDSDCIPIGELDQIVSEINNFIDFAGLTPEGNWSDLSFLSVTELQSAAIESISSFGDDIGELENEVNSVVGKTLENVNKLKPKEINIPEDYI